MGFRIQEGDFLCGKPLSEQSNRLKNLPILFCAAERGEEVYIPNGGFIPLPNDNLYVIGEPVGLSQFFRLLGRYLPKIKTVFIIGGGKITHYLATLLSKMSMHVTIVEQKMERCQALSEQLPMPPSSAEMERTRSFWSRKPGLFRRFYCSDRSG